MNWITIQASALPQMQAEQHNFRLRHKDAQIGEAEHRYCLWLELLQVLPDNFPWEVSLVHPAEGIAVVALVAQGQIAMPGFASYAFDDSISEWRQVKP